MLSDDVLPQPYRFINKLVRACVDDALEIAVKLAMQGYTGGKAFVPPRTLPSVASQQHGFGTFPTGMEGEVPIPSASCSFVDVAHTVVGLVDGRVLIYDTATGVLAHVSPTLFGGTAPTLVRTSGMNFSPTPQSVFCASNGKLVEIFAFAPQGSLPGHPPVTTKQPPQPTAPPAQAPTPTPAAATTPPQTHTQPQATTPATSCVSPRVLVGCYDAEYVYHSLVSVPADAVDGRAITSLQLSEDGSLLVITTEPSTVTVLKMPPKSLDEEAAVESVTKLLDVGMPPWALRPGPAIPSCTIMYLPPTPPALGYYRESSVLQQVAHTLCVAWQGQAVFTSAALQDPTPLISETVAGLKEQVAKMEAAEAQQQQQRLQQQQQPQGGAAGSHAKGAGKAGKGAGAAAPTGNVPVVADVVMPQLPKWEFFDGVRHHIMPHIICCTASNQKGTLCAIGCLDGITQVWNPATGAMKYVFNEAPHRAQQLPVNMMCTTALRFTPDDKYLIASIHVPQSGPKSSIVVYSLEQSARVSRVRYLENLQFAMPFAALPVMLFMAQKKLYVAELRTGTLVAEVALPPNTGADLRSHPELAAGLTDAVDFGKAWQEGITSFDDRITFASLVGDRFVASSVSAVDVVLAAFPVLREVYTCPTVEQLKIVLENVRAEERTDADALRKHQLPSCMMNSFAKKPSVAVASSAGSVPLSGRSKSDARPPSERASNAAATLGPVKKALPAAPTHGQLVHYMIESRESGRLARQKRVAELQNVIKAALKRAA